MYMDLSLSLSVCLFVCLSVSPPLSLSLSLSRSLGHLTFQALHQRHADAYLWFNDLKESQMRLHHKVKYSAVLQSLEFLKERILQGITIM